MLHSRCSITIGKSTYILTIDTVNGVPEVVIPPALVNDLVPRPITDDCAQSFRPEPGLDQLQPRNLPSPTNHRIRDP